MYFPKRSATLFITLGLFLFTDRVLKWISEAQPLKETELFSKIAHFGFYPNPHLIFFLDLPPLLSFGAMLAALTLLVIFFLEQKPKNRLPFYFIFAGALSNFYDRAASGAVIDFLKIFNSSTINLADILISIGAGSIIVSLYYETAQTKKRKVYEQGE